MTPACAQTCPTQAITFGNLRDEKSLVTERAREGESRAYHALHVLNTRPAITYLAKVTREPGREVAAKHVAGRAPAKHGDDGDRG